MLDGSVLSDAMGEMHFKGIDLPVHVWRLRGMASEALTTARSLFVGRKAELEQFKGIARALRVACEIDARQATAVPSTKGVL